MTIKNRIKAPELTNFNMKVDLDRGSRLMSGEKLAGNVKRGGDDQKFTAV